MNRFHLRRASTLTVAITFVLLAGVARVNAAVIFVNADAAGANDGSSWQDAFIDLQDALAAATGGDELWVAQATYTPAPPDGDRGASFELANGVGLYGGFAGDETDLDQRDPDVHITILSGDLNADDGPDFENNGENSYQILIGSDTDSSAVLDGFTITAGNQDAGGLGTAGIDIIEGSPSITGCRFVDNTTLSSGGAVRVAGGSPTFTDCSFIGNRSVSFDAGAVYVTATTYYAGSPRFVNCLFLNNSAERDGGAIKVYCGSGNDPTFECPTFINCSFLGNTAGELGGGIFHDYTWNAPGATLVNCIFSGNIAVIAGGGMYVLSSSPQLTNCTFSGNTADITGGLYAGQIKFLTASILTNCILWGNTDSTGTGESAQFGEGLIGYTELNYCCIQGLTGELGGVGNIADDPLFIDPIGSDGTLGTEDDDLRLSQSSPCIDAGDNASLPSDEFDLDDDSDTKETVPFDLYGLRRQYDDPATDDTGSGTPPIVDIGAYEFQDCNGNGIPDDQDIAQGTSQDQNDNQVPDDCEDCNGNGIPDDLDLSGGTSQDCNDNEIPDECEDCNGNGIADSCDIAAGSSQDCNANEIPDECIDLEEDCNGNDHPDECDIAGGSSPDCNANGIPDECIDLEEDCNGNDHPDECDIAEGTSVDCTVNGIPDECEPDCNANGTADECELADDPTLDCNLNSILDDCDLAGGTSADINGDGIPDECEFMCASVSELVANDAAQSDWFGFSVALADLTAVMGSPLDDANGSSSGSAYVFRFNGSAWFQQTRLFASDGAGSDEFGAAVAILGELVVVGAPSHDAAGASNAGAVYVFAYDGVSWVEQQELVASVAETDAHFGDSVAVSGDTIVIGAPDGTGITENSGAAYVFRYDGSAWIEEQKLFASDGEIGDLFGVDVAVNGDIALIGAEDDHNDNGVFTGAAYVFRHDGSTWVEEQKLVSWIGGSSYDRFGGSGALSGEADTIMIGARQDNDGGNNSGAVYVFRYDSDQSAWVGVQKMKADDGSSGDAFGASVDISGNIGLVGAEYGDDGVIQAGSAYVYRYLPDEMIWVQKQELLPPDSETSGSFGHAVAFSGTVALVGAYQDDDNGNASGSAYLFVDPFDVDCNDNGAVDFCDIGDGTSEDADGDGIPDECQLVQNLTQGSRYPDIQSAIAAANDGDEIEVEAGIYVENIDFLAKELTVRSTDPLDPDVVEVTIIDGDGVGTVVTLSAGMISGFTITGGAQSGTKAGGVHATGTAVVSHNLITVNNASKNGGGVIARDTAVVRNNHIVANSATELGGGVSARDGSLVIDNYIAFNSAQFGGGGVRTRENPTVRNNTIVFNSSADAGPSILGGGGILASDAALILNNVIAFSTDGTGLHSTVTDSPIADYNCVFGNFDGDYSEEATPGPNDLNVDPALGEDGLHLLSSSPCIDAGDPDLDPLADETDIDGEDRIHNDRVDIGADEVAVCEGDANGDGAIDPLDTGFVLSRLGCSVGTGDPGCDAADANTDGAVDPLDIGFILSRFGECS